VSRLPPAIPLLLLLPLQIEEGEGIGE